MYKPEANSIMNLANKRRRERDTSQMLEQIKQKPKNRGSISIPIDSKREKEGHPRRRVRLICAGVVDMVGRSGDCGGPVLWRLADEINLPEIGYSPLEAECIQRFHFHETKENQCTSTVLKHIKAPVQLVWSMLRRFDQPQRYKPFVSRCIMQGDFAIGCLRQVNVKSGLPATTSTERLEQLDDNEHILSIKIVGGDHRLQNYSSVVTAHPDIIDGRPGTLVIESFVVDVPEGNTKDDTCFFVEALIKCNLKSLAAVSERLVVQDLTEPIAI